MPFRLSSGNDALGLQLLTGLMSAPEEIYNKRVEAAALRHMYRTAGADEETINQLAPGSDTAEPLGGTGVAGKILSGIGKTGSVLSTILGAPIKAPRVEYGTGEAALQQGEREKLAGMTTDPKQKAYYRLGQYGRAEGGGDDQPDNPFKTIRHQAELLYGAGPSLEKDQWMIDTYTRMQAGITGAKKDVTTGIDTARKQWEDENKKRQLQGLPALPEPSGSFAPTSGGAGGTGGVQPGGGRTRADRNNNPGNIKATDFTRNFPGVVGVDPKPASDGGNFLIFDKPESGFNGMRTLLKSNYGHLSTDAGMRRWSGGGYGAARLGLDPHRPISDYSDDELNELTQRMARQGEGYSGGGGAGGGGGGVQTAAGDAPTAEGVPGISKDVPIYPGAQGFVFHTSGDTTMSSLVDTLHKRRLGSEYVMDRDGTIYSFAGRGSPHIQPNDRWGGIAPGLSNQNALGMEIVGRDEKDMTPAQVDSARRFMAANYPTLPVYGHGEVNPVHKKADEGLTVADAIRADRKAGTRAEPTQVAQNEPPVVAFPSGAPGAQPGPQPSAPVAAPAAPVVGPGGVAPQPQQPVPFAAPPSPPPPATPAERAAPAPNIPAEQGNLAISGVKTNYGGVDYSWEQLRHSPMYNDISISMGIDPQTQDPAQGQKVLDRIRETQWLGQKQDKYDLIAQSLGLPPRGLRSKEDSRRILEEARKQESNPTIDVQIGRNVSSRNILSELLKPIPLQTNRGYVLDKNGNQVLATMPDGQLMRPIDILSDSPIFASLPMLPGAALELARKGAFEDKYPGSMDAARALVQAQGNLATFVKAAGDSSNASEREQAMQLVAFLPNANDTVGSAYRKVVGGINHFEHRGTELLHGRTLGESLEAPPPKMSENPQWWREHGFDPEKMTPTQIGGAEAARGVPAVRGPIGTEPAGGAAPPAAEPAPSPAGQGGTQVPSLDQYYERKRARK